MSDKQKRVERRLLERQKPLEVKITPKTSKGRRVERRKDESAEQKKLSKAQSQLARKIAGLDK